MRLDSGANIYSRSEVMMMPHYFLVGLKIGFRRGREDWAMQGSPMQLPSLDGTRTIAARIPVAGSSETRMIDRVKWPHSVCLGESRATSADVCRYNRGIECCREFMSIEDPSVEGCFLRGPQSSISSMSRMTTCIEARFAASASNAAEFK